MLISTQHTLHRITNFDWSESGVQWVSVCVYLCWTLYFVSHQAAFLSCDSFLCAVLYSLRVMYSFIVICLLIQRNVLNTLTHSVWRKPLALSQACSNTGVRTHKVNSPPERLILAADMVMKQLNHGPAPRSNCACVCVCFLFLQQLTCLNSLLTYSYTTHTSTPLIDMAIPCHAYFSPQEGPQANYA